MRKICLICRLRDADNHHVKSRGSGGSDDPFNLVPLCRKHHTEIHQIGTGTFSDKYDVFKNWLLSNGWEYNELIKKWRHK